MSVTSTQQLRAYPRGKVSIGGVMEHTTLHRVKTDSLNDGIEVVAAAIGTPGVTTFSFGGATDTAAVLKDVTPKREKDKSLYWKVTSNWGPLDDKDEQQTGRKEEGVNIPEPPPVAGEATNNPLEFADTIERDVMWRQAEMWEAQFKGSGVLGNNCDAYKVDQVYAIGNSAGEIRDPPEFEEYPVALWRFTIHRARFLADKAQRFTNAINEDHWTWTSKIWAVTINAAPETAWCQSWIGGMSVINGFPVARINITIAIDPDGWGIKFPDMGYRRKLNLQSEPIDNPPYFDVNGQPLDAPRPGVTYVEMKDAYGEPIRQPAALDGHGLPLGEGQETRYLYWLSRRLHRVSFNDILSR